VKRVLLISSLIVFSSPVCAFDIKGINPVNPLDNTTGTYQQEVEIPVFELKRATLTKNAIKNQYKIAMDKFINSNIRSSYSDFRVLIDSITPNDYVYMRFTQEMASIGFFNLAELAMSKIQDEELASLLENDVKRFYFPAGNLTQKDQFYLAEVYSNIMYNDQSREATSELMKHSTLLVESDYANYLVAFGSMKNGDIKQAKKYINAAISKNPKNLNYKRLKGEILSQSDNPKEAIAIIDDLDKKDISTVVFDKELHSSKQYVLYKTTKNEYWKKYHLAYYYYDKNELNKAITTLQTAISGKKNINKEVFALTAMVYYELKEFEKAQDYAQKALDIDGNNTKSLIIMGDYAFRNQKYSDAQKYYKKASSNDDTYSAQVKLAKTYQKLNNIAKAKEIYSKILKISSRTFEAYYQMALLEKDREIAYLKKAIAINPNFKDAWIDLARISINKNDYENAASFLGVAKYIDDNDSRYYYYNGLVLKNKGLTAEAKKSFEQSVNLDPENNLAKEELNI